MNKFIGLSGLPRTGSTLLSSILSQNPDIHAEGNSAVCQLMWDTQENYKRYEQVHATNRMWGLKNIVSAIPEAYYKHVDAPIIFDKCRSWTLPTNMDLFKNFIDKKPKVIVLVRPVEEIVKSFIALWNRNNRQVTPEYLLTANTDYLMRSLDGVRWAKQNNKGEFLFITYADLVDKTENVVNEIYKFCEIEPYKHDFNNIVNNYPENDAIYNLKGQHDIRPTIGYRALNIELSDDIIAKCKALDV